MSPRRRTNGPLRPRLVLGLGLTVAFAYTGLLGIAFSTFSAGGAVLVNDPSFTYVTPPTNFCPYTANVWYGPSPPPVYQVAPGGHFTVSLDYVCEPYDMNLSATYAITGFSSVSEGFTISSSDVPVTFGANTVGSLVVTLTAPDWPGTYSPTIVLTGGPTSSTG